MSEERIMSYLDEKGNMHGPFVGSIDCSEIEGLILSPKEYESKEQREKRKLIYEQTKQASQAMERIKNFGGNVTVTKIEDGHIFSMDSWPVHQDRNGNWNPGHYKPKERPIEQIINEGNAIIKAKDNKIESLKKDRDRLDIMCYEYKNELTRLYDENKSLQDTIDSINDRFTKLYKASTSIERFGIIIFVAIMALIYIIKFCNL